MLLTLIHYFIQKCEFSKHKNSHCTSSRSLKIYVARIQKLTRTRKLGFKLPLKNSKSNTQPLIHFKSSTILGERKKKKATFQRWLPNTPFPLPMAGMVNKLGHSFFPTSPGVTSESSLTLNTVLLLCVNIHMKDAVYFAL